MDGTIRPPDHKNPKAGSSLAYERTFSRSLSLLDHEVYLLLRRIDTFPLYVAGTCPDLPD